MYRAPSPSLGLYRAPSPSQGAYRAPSPYGSAYAPPVPQKDTQQGCGVAELPAPATVPRKDNQPINELPA